jgi:cytochrome d ubiquinol oxidase subunit I
MTPLDLHRLHFAFTITYHYLFPQLTMGLALLIVILKTQALRTGSDRYDRAARFWAKIFAVNFAMGVATGLPMEFQFGTNWSAFSRATGGVIGQTLAMEGVFAFFLESSFLGLFLFGEKRLGPRGHWVTAVLILVGSWLSAYFIVATNAWMQHPVGFVVEPDGSFLVDGLGALLGNPWLLWMYPHVMLGSVLTGCVVMMSVGAYYVLSRRHEEQGRLFIRVALPIAFVASVLQIFPTGDNQGRMVALHQPATLAAMEGLFRTEDGAPLVILGQPNMETQTLDNPLAIPDMLSFLTYRRWKAEVVGLESFPPEEWPDNIPLLYYSYRLMVGLGTIFIAAFGLAFLLLLRRRLFSTRLVLWGLMLLLPFPYIANTAGWMTAELGRQPWVVHGLMRTADGVSPGVSGGNALFTLIGFMGLYMVLGILFLFLIWRELQRGPDGPAEAR